MLFSRLVFNVIDYATYLNCNLSLVKDVVKEKNITYNESLPDTLKADLYYIKRSGKYPVLINIHGGGFVAGDKKFRPGYAKYMADNGMFVMNINYGLCPEFTFPDFILHSLSSLQWVKDNADKYNLDIDNLFVAGDSAGAYIAAYLGILSANPSLRKQLNIGDMPLKIKALLLYSAPYHLETLLSKKILLNLQAEIGSAFFNISKEDVMNPSRLDAHPMRNLINITPYINKDFPKSFVSYPKYDFLCPDQGPPFIQLLEDNNIPYRKHYALRRMDTHCYHLFWHNRNGREAMKLSKDFINAVLAGEI